MSPPKEDSFIYNRVETEREMPKLEFVTHGVLTDYDMLLYLARISIWYLDSPDHNRQEG